MECRQIFLYAETCVLLGEWIKKSFTINHFKFSLKILGIVPTRNIRNWKKRYYFISGDALDIVSQQL
jgi:hypothetical protein